MRVHAGAAQRYCASPGCGALRQESCEGTAIIEHHWHEEPKGALPQAVCEEAAEALAMPGGEQLALWKG